MVRTTVFYEGRGYTLHAPTCDDVVFGVWTKLKKFYEYQALDKIKKLNLTGTYIDVGANMGNHSLFFAAECCAQIVAFEPLLPARKLFYATMAANGINSIEIFPSESYDYEACARIVMVPRAASFVGGIPYVMRQEEVTRNIGHTTCHYNPNRSNCYTTVTVDDILAEIEVDAPVLIKIDVEGHETDVACGALRTISKCKAILVELMTDAAYNQFAAVVQPLGFTCDHINLCPGWGRTYLWTR